MPGTRHGLLIAPVACVAALLVLTACGGEDEDADAAKAVPGGIVSAATPATPLPCTASTGMALPAGWPGGLPLPTGLVVTRTEQRTGDRLVVTGRVPGDFHGVVDFFNAQLPKAGYTPSEGEIDPNDAESNFSSGSTAGRWTAGKASDCAGQAAVSVLVGPKSS